MSEKQFQIIHLGNPYEFVVKDHTTNKTYGPFEGDEKSMSDLLNEQQNTINILLEELVNAQQQGYVIGFLHKNEPCSLIPKELEDE